MTMSKTLFISSSLRKDTRPPQNRPPLLPLFCPPSHKQQKVQWNHQGSVQTQGTRLSGSAQLPAENLKWWLHSYVLF